MRYCKLHRYVTLMLLVGLGGGAGCTPPSEGEGQGTPDRKTECAMKNGQLLKPNESPSGNSPFLEEGDSDDYGFEEGGSYRVLTRPHMHSVTGEQSWLFEGEPFVLDLGQLTYGIEDKQVTMMVLLNYEPVPFKAIEVTSPDSYPTLAEIKDSGEAKMQKELHRKNGVPFNYTLVVPSKSFERGAGVYDMRVVFVPSSWSASDSSGLAQIQRITDGYAYQVYYGGCAQTEISTLEHVRGEEVEWTVMAKSLTAEANGMFLAPPTSVYDWEGASNPEQAELNREYAFSEDVLRLTLYAMMNDAHRSRGVDVDDVTYVLFEGDQIIRRFRYTPSYSSERGPEYFRNAEDRKAMHIDINTEGKSSAEYTVMAFTNPMDAPASHTYRVIASNTLSFRFD